MPLIMLVEPQLRVTRGMVRAPLPRSFTGRASGRRMAGEGVAWKSFFEGQQWRKNFLHKTHQQLIYLNLDNQLLILDYVKMMEHW